MSHDTGGYFFCTYEYHAPYTDAQGVRHTDATHKSRLYSATKKQDHKAQSDWYDKTFMPAAKKHVEEVFTTKINKDNKKGLIYDAYDPNNIRAGNPKWSKTVPEGREDAEDQNWAWASLAMDSIVARDLLLELVFPLAAYLHFALQ